jgi:hypothetical protein
MALHESQLDSSHTTSDVLSAEVEMKHLNQWYRKQVNMPSDGGPSVLGSAEVEMNLLNYWYRMQVNMPSDGGPLSAEVS